MELVFEVPGPDAPGYLRRQRKALEFRQASNTPEGLDSLVNFLVEYVKVPKDRKEAKKALWDASEEQIDELLDSISGTGKVPPKREGDSEST